MRTIQKMQHSTSKQEIKKLKREKEIFIAYQDYLKQVQKYIGEIQETMKLPVAQELINTSYTQAINDNIEHAKNQIELIKRRIFNGEKIPHKDKIFSIFQSHTEWINKGKAGVPVELGMRVCIVEHPCGYVLNHMVMENKTDSEVVLQMIKQTQKLYADFKGCSFDQGFHSPSNQIDLKEMLDDVILPKKGRCNTLEVQRENSQEFRTAKRMHSAVESGINALEVHGLDKCLDHGVLGFKRYVAMAVVGRNIQKLGSVIIAKHLAQLKRIRKKMKLAA
jgi:IS5 family transposase